MDTQRTTWGKRIADNDLSAMATLSSVNETTLLANLHKPNPRIFWLDLAITGWLAWTAFVVSMANGTPPAWRIFLVLVAAAAFYRGLCFLHEIVHVRRAVLPGFEPAWNIIFGIPLCVPSVMYVGVHQNHHKLTTYGTSDDPEYLPFAGKPAMIVFFILQSTLLPSLLVVRFLGLVWLGLVIPPFHRWLAAHATALTMNLKYVRPVTAQLVRTMTIQESVVLGGWGLALALNRRGIIPNRAIIIWYAMAALLCLTNTLRTLAAHRYRSSGKPLGREEQLHDSVDIPGGFWTELWAPVGLRYHAMHHYYPGIPYHNLGQAYLRLHSQSPSLHAVSSEDSILASLRSLMTHRAVG